jgi:hypothetical protein
LKNLIRTNSHFRENLEAFGTLSPNKKEKDFLDTSFDVEEEDTGMINLQESSRKQLIKKSSKFEIESHKRVTSKGRSKELVTIFR